MFIIGYPAEVDQFPQPTISRDILSNLRDWERSGITYLQTDSEVAGGQSGGVLVNLRGEVIGLTTFANIVGNYTLAASSTDFGPILQTLSQRGFTSELGDRRLPVGDGSYEFEIELRNLWDTREFVFEGADGTTADIEIEGDGDGKFRVFDSFGLVLEVDDGYTGVESAEAELTTTGLHFLQVEMATGGEPSKFHVTRSVRLKPLNDPDDGRTIKVGDTIAASLDHPGDWDWYSINLGEGDTVRVSADSLNVDTLLYVDSPDSDDNQTVSDDDSGGGLFGLNSEIVYRAPKTREYFIVVTEATELNSGGYYLSVEFAPGDAPLTRTSTPHLNPTSAESEILTNDLYDCITTNESARQSLLHEISEGLQESGMTRDEARAAAESYLDDRELILSILRLGIEAGAASEFSDVLSEHCEEVEPQSRLPTPAPGPGPTDTFGQYFQGQTLHVSVVDLERLPELRYSTIDPNQVVRRWSLLPSAPGNELVLLRLKVENHTADGATINIDSDAAELRDLHGASYRPVSVSGTVWQDFRGDPKAVAVIDQSQCFAGVGTLIDAGTTVQWQSEANSDHYLASVHFLDRSIAIGPDGRAELGPGASISHAFPDPGTYPFICLEVEDTGGFSVSAERLAEIRVMPIGEQEDVAEKSVLFLEGSFELPKGYGLDGYMVFEAPADKEFKALQWKAGDFILVVFDAQTIQRTHAQDPETLQEYAVRFAGGPGAIYVGDINQLAGPAPTVDQGDFDGNVPLGALERHLWIYESPLYQDLLEKARLTDPMPMTYDGPTITIRHACINRLLLPCRLMETYLAPNLKERTNGKLEFITSSFPEFGLTGLGTLALVTDGTLDSATIDGGYAGFQMPPIEIQNLWGIYSSHEQEFEAAQVIIKDIEELVLSETGGVVMNHNWYAGHDRFFFCREKIDTLDGFVGKKTFSHSAALSDWVNGMGAHANFLAFAEVYTAMERGILDCGVTGADAGYGLRLYEVTDYIIGPLLSFPSNNNVINGEKWASIPEDLQQIIIEEAAKSELEALRVAAIQNEIGLIKNTTERWAGQDAMEFVPFSDEMSDRSNTAVMEHVVQGWVNRIGDNSHPIIADTFNRKIGPIIGLRIGPDGWVVRVPPQAPHEGVTIEQEREPTASPVSQTLLANLAKQAEEGLVELTAYQTQKGYHRTGTGFIFETDGGTAFVVTYGPFIEFDGEIASRIEVRVGRAYAYQATVVGFDPYQYVAVLSICCDDNFTALELETSGSPQTGTQAIAVGYPEFPGRASSDCVVPPCAIVTAGKIQSPELNWRGMFAHDAHLSSDYFGGPLLSTEGKVWGVNVGVSGPEGSLHTVPYEPINELLSKQTGKVQTPTPTGTADYDTDNDGLIEISNLEQLDSMRHDLDGDCVAANSDYASAFPNALTGMGCPSSGCSGYELTTNLDFDTNGNDMPDAGDRYWNDGAGWVPLGDRDREFSAIFDGNENTIANLYLDGVIADVGLFGLADYNSKIRHIGLTSIDVSNASDSSAGSAGSLVGLNQGEVNASYATGSVFGSANVGGLVGANVGVISASYAEVSVTGGGHHNSYTGGLVGQNAPGAVIFASYATGSVTAQGDSTGGLVGGSNGDSEIVASYATGSVSGGNSDTGGLVGKSWYTTIVNSYATGRVSSLLGQGGGLVGEKTGGEIRDSYWNIQTSGKVGSAGGEGKTTLELQAPTSEIGIYANWHADRWDFGTSRQYPALKYAGLDLSAHAVSLF